MQANSLTSKTLLLFIDDEIRTLEEIQEWLSMFLKPEQCYRSYTRKFKSIPTSLEDAVRVGAKEAVRSTMRYLLWDKAWLVDADDKLETGKTPIVGDYSFRLTPAGKEALLDLPPKGKKRAGRSNHLWKLIRKLYEQGKIRVQLKQLDGSPLNANVLRNGVAAETH